MLDDYEDDLDEILDEGLDWDGEVAEIAEALREGLEDDYDASPEELQEALFNVFDSLTPAESFNLAKALKQIEQGGSKALSDPALGQIARTALPIAGGAVGTVLGGPAGAAVGSSIGQAAVKALPAPSTRRRAAAPGPSPVANGSAAALRGLVLTQKPEALKSLLAVALGQAGRTHVDGVPVGAVLNLLSSVFGQAAADADELLYRRDGASGTADADAETDESLVSPADRALALYADLVDVESEELSEVASW